jgi:hypothetical protein
MSVDFESGALVWQRFKLFRYPAQDPLTQPLRQLGNITSTSKQLQRARPIELLERRVMMSGGYLSAGITGTDVTS